MHLQPPHYPQPRQTNLSSLPWYPHASRNLLHSSLTPHNLNGRVSWFVHRLTDPSCSRQALKIPILEELHWHFTKAFIFTNSYLHYFCCFFLCILGSLHPSGYEPFFCPLYISSSPQGIHTPSPTPLPRDMSPLQAARGPDSTARWEHQTDPGHFCCRKTEGPKETGKIAVKKGMACSPSPQAVIPDSLLGYCGLETTTYREGRVSSSQSP